MRVNNNLLYLSPSCVLSLLPLLHLLLLLLLLNLLQLYGMMELNTRKY